MRCRRNLLRSMSFRLPQSHRKRWSLFCLWTQLWGVKYFSTWEIEPHQDDRREKWNTGHQWHFKNNKSDTVETLCTQELDVFGNKFNALICSVDIKRLLYMKAFKCHTLLKFLCRNRRPVVNTSPDIPLASASVNCLLCLWVNESQLIPNLTDRHHFLNTLYLSYYDMRCF